MAGLRLMGARSSEVPATMIQQGDTVLNGENLLAGLLTTVGAGTWLGAAIASGTVTRSGPVGGYTDTTDTADNVIAALAGNGSADLAPGTSFALRFINTVAQAMTLAAGRGFTLDTTNGSKVVNCAASLVRKYICTFTNTTRESIQICNFLAATPRTVNFNLSSGQTARPLAASNGGGLNISIGQLMTGTGITTGTKVTGLIQGQGGLLGVTTDTDVASDQTGSGITFSPTINIASIGTDGL